MKKFTIFAASLLFTSLVSADIEVGNSDYGLDFIFADTDIPSIGPEPQEVGPATQRYNSDNMHDCDPAFIFVDLDSPVVAKSP